MTAQDRSGDGRMERSNRHRSSEAGHPTARALLLMLGVVVLIALLAAAPLLAG
jgi:hypothetical protein